VVFGKRLQGVAPTLDVRLFGKDKCVIFYVLPWFSLYYFETMSLPYHAQMKVLLVTHIFGIQRTYAFVVLITGTSSSAPLFSELNSTGTVKLMISI
jgi:hypothetical protein